MTTPQPYRDQILARVNAWRYKMWQIHVGPDATRHWPIRPRPTYLPLVFDDDLPPLRMVSCFTPLAEVYTLF